MEVSKLKFEPKDVIMITGGMIAFLTQLNILSSKIDSANHKAELKYQNHEFRITALEYNKEFIVPTSPKVPEKPKEE